MRVDKSFLINALVFKSHCYIGDDFLLFRDVRESAQHSRSGFLASFLLKSSLIILSYFWWAMKFFYLVIAKKKFFWVLEIFKTNGWGQWTSFKVNCFQGDQLNLFNFYGVFLGISSSFKVFQIQMATLLHIFQMIYKLNGAANRIFHLNVGTMSQNAVIKNHFPGEKRNRNISFLEWYFHFLCQSRQIYHDHHVTSCQSSWFFIHNIFK